jgi:uncharacterized membrane protein YhaH (DUF805 family)
MMDWRTLLFSFEGRASTRDFWKYQIVLLLLSIVIVLVSPQPEIAVGMGIGELYREAMAATPWWHWPIMLAMLYTGLAVATKRWHDQDRSAWWNLLLLLFPLGALVMIGMLGFIRGTPGPNRYGAAPVH